MLAAISPLGNLHLLALSAGGDVGAYAKTPTATPPTVAKAASASVNSCGRHHRHDRRALGPRQRRPGRVDPGLRLDDHQRARGRRGQIQRQRHQRGEERYGHLHRGGRLRHLGDDRRRRGLSVTSSVKVTVAQTLTGISLYTGGAKVLVNPSTPLKVTGTSQTLSAVALDQFGNALAIQPSFTWAATSYPSGAMPSFTPAAARKPSPSPRPARTASPFRPAAQRRAGDRPRPTIARRRPADGLSPSARSAATRPVRGTSVQFTVSQFLDQFHNPLPETTTLTWAATSVPGGAAAPQFSYQRLDDHRQVLGGRHVRCSPSRRPTAPTNAISQVDRRAVVVQVPTGTVTGSPHHGHRHQPAIAGAVVRRPVRQADRRDLPG